MNKRFIFVTGGVTSSLGKGVLASSLGLLLKRHGLKVFLQKFDPYLNIDPGTMSPLQHGEVYVTHDGAETDLDLGHYERWVDIELTKESSVTSGKVYRAVMDKERKGLYLGATIQVIPHVTNEIKSRLIRAAERSNADVVITEIGGTVGDIESLPFLEAIRQMRLELGYENTMFIHNTLVPYLAAAGESKTKPTQHSVKELLGLGIQPDAIVLRSEVELSAAALRKISLFCNIKEDGVFQALDQKIIYELPLLLSAQGLDKFVLNHLRLESSPLDLEDWKGLIGRIKSADKEVNVALVGKYVELHDAYLSVVNALNHAAFELGAKLKIKWVQAADITERNVGDLLEGADAIIVPGGFGERGTSGMKEAIRYARENEVPFLGICLGMQLSLIEFAEHELGLNGANTTEFDPQAKHPIIDLLPNQYAGIDLGGTMRLGAYECQLQANTLARKLYGASSVWERHRHRYEFNSAFKDEFEKKGLVFSGINPQTGLVEIIEIPSHPFFVAAQFHPEFTSRPLRANPLFRGFVKSGLKRHGT